MLVDLHKGGGKTESARRRDQRSDFERRFLWNSKDFLNPTHSNLIYNCAELH